jgi:hypothetical protein
MLLFTKNMKYLSLCLKGTILQLKSNNLYIYLTNCNIKNMPFAVKYLLRLLFPGYIYYIIF